MPRVLTLNFADSKFHVFAVKMKNCGLFTTKLFTYKVTVVFEVYHAFDLLKTAFIWRIQVR